jgi:hypothetical protein
MLARRFLSSTDDPLSAETTNTIATTTQLSLLVGFIILGIFELVRNVTPLYGKRLRSVPDRAPKEPAKSPLSWIRPTLSVGDKQV